MKIIGQIIQRNWLGLAIAIIVLFFLFQKCENNRIKDDTITALTSQNTTYKNAFGALTTKTNTIQLTADALEDLIIKKNDTIAKLVKSFSSIKAIVTTNTTVQIDTIKVPFVIPVKCSFVREDTINRNWYSFRYRIDSLGLNLTDLKIPNTQVVTTGVQRKWFLGKTTLVTEIANTNPHIKNTATKSYQTVVKTKWYESKLAYFIAGAVTIKATQELITK